MARYSKNRMFASRSTGAAPAAGTPYENAGVAALANPGNATGPGDEFAYVPAGPGAGYQYPVQIAWAVSVSGGTLSALVVNLEVSDDGVTWVQLDTQNSVTGGRKVVQNTIGPFVRANIGTYTVATGTPIVQTTITQ